MIQHIYLIILGYFFLGGLGFFLINRRKDASVRKQNWLKYASYFAIINILFFSIVIHGPWFRILSLIIILGGYFELWKVFRQAGYIRSGLFSRAMAVFLVLALGFFAFGYLDRQVMLFAFLVLSVFDAFGQIFGQLLGRTKLVPRISPNKTLEGLLGGLLFAFISSLLLKGLFPGGMWARYIISSGILVFAFTGDMLSSWFKRRYGVKDFSEWIPGHGGFLDRFDSLIMAGAFMALMSRFFF